MYFQKDKYEKKTLEISIFERIENLTNTIPMISNALVSRNFVTCFKSIDLRFGHFFKIENRVLVLRTDSNLDFYYFQCR
jgi:hypothetical protein